MSADDAIEEIWLSYQMMTDALTVTARGLNLGSIDLLKGTYFIDNIPDVLNRDFELCRIAAEDYVILAMWAVFERQVISALVEESEKMIAKPSSEFNSGVHNKVVDSIEYWRTSDILDLLKPLVGGDLAGKAKQVKRHRDWLAHKNPKKPSPGNVPPTLAYQVLLAIVRRLSNRYSPVTERIA